MFLFPSWCSGSAVKIPVTARATASLLSVHRHGRTLVGPSPVLQLVEDAAVRMSLQHRVLYQDLRTMGTAELLRLIFLPHELPTPQPHSLCSCLLASLVIILLLIAYTLLIEFKRAMARGCCWAALQEPVEIQAGVLAPAVTNGRDKEHEVSCEQILPVAKRSASSSTVSGSCSRVHGTADPNDSHNCLLLLFAALPHRYLRGSKCLFPRIRAAVIYWDTQQPEKSDFYFRVKEQSESPSPMC